MTASYMALALELARRARGTTGPNPPVGAVLIRDGEIVGEGMTQPGGRPHAEVMALRAAGGRAAGASLFVTLEPCCHWGRTPPCADALVAAGITSAHVALLDPNPAVNGEGAGRLRGQGIEVSIGECAGEAAEVVEAHLTYVRTKRPFVTLASQLPAELISGLMKEHDLTIVGADAVEVPSEGSAPIARLRQTPNSLRLELVTGTLETVPRLLPRLVEAASYAQLLNLLARDEIRSILLLANPTTDDALAAACTIDKIVTGQKAPPRAGFVVRRRITGPIPHVVLYPANEGDGARCLPG